MQSVLQRKTDASCTLKNIPCISINYLSLKTQKYKKYFNFNNFFASHITHHRETTEPHRANAMTSCHCEQSEKSICKCWKKRLIFVPSKSQMIFDFHGRKRGDFFVKLDLFFANMKVSRFEDSMWRKVGIHVVAWTWLGFLHTRLREAPQIAGSG